MNTRRELFLVCYDISGKGFERRLTKVRNVVRAFAEPLQYSVYLAYLDPIRLALLEAELRDLSLPKRDQVLIIPLGNEGQIKKWRCVGKPVVARESVAFII